MRFVVSLLSLVVVASALVALNLALIVGVAEDFAPGLPRIKLADAGAMLGLGAVAALLIWVQPAAAEATLWLAALAGLAGMTIEARMLADRGAAGGEHMTPQLRLASILLSGGGPAVAGLSAALITHRFIHPHLFGLA